MPLSKHARLKLLGMSKPPTSPPIGSLFLTHFLSLLYLQVVKRISILRVIKTVTTICVVSFNNTRRHFSTSNKISRDGTTLVYWSQIGSEHEYVRPIKTLVEEQQTYRLKPNSITINFTEDILTMKQR